MIAGRLRMAGLAVHRTDHEGCVRLAAMGDGATLDWDEVRTWPDVSEVRKIPVPFKLGSRAFHPQDTVITVGRCAIGSEQLALMAGPCSIEGEAQAFTIAEAVAKAGATIMRGGAFKPRTSPYSFQGLGEEGLKILRRAADAHGLAVVSEVMDTQQVAMVARYADILQLGARNMQNYALLREVGHAEKPVLLKRGLAATIEEWLMSAEHILSQGNAQVILCERGIRTFETYTRNTLDLNAIPVVKRAQPPARDRRSVARHRHPQQGGADGARRDRGRRRRTADRGAPRSRSRAVGWRAVALPRAVRRPGASDPHHRRGARAQGLIARRPPASR